MTNPEAEEREYEVEEVRERIKSSRGSRFRLIENELRTESTQRKFCRESFINGIKDLSNGLVIHPENRWYRAWINFILIWAVYSSFFTPMEFGFFRGLPENLFILDIAGQITFLLDIVLQFFVAYRDTQTYIIVHKRTHIALRFLKSGFVIDLLGCMPWDIIYKACGRREEVRYLLWIRLSRVRKVTDFFRNMERDIRINYMFTRIVKLIVVELYCTHTAACIFYYLATTLPSSEEGYTWIGSLQLGDYSYSNFRDIDIWKRYTTSLYFAIVTMATVATTSMEAWRTLESVYAKPSRGRITTHRTNLMAPEQGDKSIMEYMQDIKRNVDALALMGQKVDWEDLVLRIIKGLNPAYDLIGTALKIRQDPVTFEELFEQLLNEEAHCKLPKSLTISTSDPATALVTSSSASSFTKDGSKHTNKNTRPFNNNNKSFRPPQSQQWTPRPHHAAQSTSYQGKCQLCRITGHSAPQCQFFPQSALASLPSLLPRGSSPQSYPSYSAHSAMHHGISYDPQEWVVDSGASHHITTDLANLSLHSPYTANDNVVIGNGNGLSISHTGSFSINIHNRPLHFSNVLFVPDMTMNLISVSALCSTNPVTVLFFDSHFQVQDRHTGVTLVRGERKNGVYYWPSTIPLNLAKTALTVSSSSSLSLWHSRLGHPSSRIFRKFLSVLNIQLFDEQLELFSCNSCHINKSHKLPFYQSSITSLSPLDVIFSDVWTSPVYSFDGYKYYVIFVDHFTKYVWLYPLKRKSDVHSVFEKFKALVENYFSRKIKTLFTDNGGEYLALKSFLSLHGITHLTTPPHTPEHNGYSERRHRHISDTGLTLLHQAHLPLSFWPFAYATAVYLINRMPKVDLAFSSSFEALFQSKPNLSKLRIFGCLCYPWLRPYSSHKLSPKSTRCVFLGYSLTQSAFLCYDLSSHKIFVSRHVRFVEHTFPYLSISPLVDTVFNSDTATNPWDSPAPPLRPSSTAGILGAHPLPLDSSSAPSHLPTSDSLSSAPVSVSLQRQSHSDSVTSLVDSAQSSPPLAALPDLPSTLSYNPGNDHHMQTRSKNAIFKPNPKYGLSTLISSDIEPTTVKQALSNPDWTRAMQLEYDALIRNNTWELVPRDKQQNIIGCKWVFRLKRNPDGSIQRQKARLVARGFLQRPGVDFHETFSPVINPVTVRTVLSIAITQSWNIRQLDVNNAFLNGHLTEEVFMEQPPGMLNKAFPDHVCRLTKALYGLKQAPRAWYEELRLFLCTLGFHPTKSDSSLFVYSHGTTIIYFLVYVDDLIITGTDSSLIEKFIRHLDMKFSTKDLGPLSFFCGVEVIQSSDGILLSQRKYVCDLLAKYNMLDSKPVSTPLSPGLRLVLHDGAPSANSTIYRQVLGSLQHLRMTRPDISFAINKLSQFMHAPSEFHWAAVKRLLRYLNGTRAMGIRLSASTPLVLHGFSDADWAGNSDDSTSTGAFVIFLGANPVSWRSTKQRTVARSSTEAEYRAIASAAAELQWMKSLLSELCAPVSSAPTLYSDNLGATYLSTNPVFHSRMKHLAIDYHFVRELVQSSALRVVHVSAENQLADALTKSLSGPKLQEICNKIGVASGTPS